MPEKEVPKNVRARRTATPLTELVDEELNKSLTDQINEDRDRQRAEPTRSGATDYARGTTEHEDEPAVGG